MNADATTSATTTTCILPLIPTTITRLGVNMSILDINVKKTLTPRIKKVKKLVYNNNIRNVKDVFYIYHDIGKRTQNRRHIANRYTCTLDYSPVALWFSCREHQRGST